MAFAMEQKLRIKEHLFPNGWKRDKISDLLEGAETKLAKLRDAVTSNGDAKNIRELSADVANFVMMIADNSGAFNNQ